MLKRFAFVALAFAAPLSAQDEVMPAPAPEYETTDVVLHTTMGDIVLALETQRAPITAANFLRYVDEHRLDGTVFYRAMRLDWGQQPNGLIQGGAQNDPARILDPIPHEPTTLTGLSHTRGAINMAMGDPGTANGDFSIMVGDQTGLDADPTASDPVWQNGYAVFGHVIEGMDVVEAIHAAPIDPELGEGWMLGQMLADPVVITRAERVAATP
ncbi:MAG: peptidylprolyl isomerase [Erythrobacter sp.]|nr:peptidylprolyl isomerase [Erythrobacter sp.]